MSVKTLIVSVFFKRQDMVEESVKSLVSQLEPDMHLLLVDDGSPDRTYEKLKAWEAPNVTVVTHPNMGFVHSVRQAIESMPSTYIAIHGSGDLSLPGRFRKQADYMDQHPAIGVVGCHSRCVYSNGEAPPYIEGKSFTGDASRRMLNGNLFHQGEVMMRRDCYEKVGGYRTFFKFAQDRDLFCRLSQVTHFHVIEEALYHRFVAVPDSVSGTASKLIVQRFLSDFACFCHSQRLAGKPDPLDEHGSRAGLFWSPSKHIRQEVFRRAIRALYFKRKGDYEIFKEALLQKDSHPVRRLFFMLADHFPSLTNRFLEAYYKNKLAGADVV